MHKVIIVWMLPLHRSASWAWIPIHACVGESAVIDAETYIRTEARKLDMDRMHFIAKPVTLESP